MSQLKKGFIAMCMTLVLCVNFSLPVNAAGATCPTCRGTNTEAFPEITEGKWRFEPCIHGHGASASDNVGYLVHYPRIYCHSCQDIQVLYNQAVWEEKTRICSIARSISHAIETR